jgi:copper oxidase (laccase) domain-containing protein
MSSNGLIRISKLERNIWIQRFIIEKATQRFNKSSDRIYARLGPNIQSDKYAIIDNEMLSRIS